MAYLDHNATSQLRPEARAAMDAALSLGGNASSIHAAGRAARACVEGARVEISALLNTKPQDVVFSSGGTEANVLALSGAIQAAAEAGQRITRLFVGAIEHDSVLKTAAALAERHAGVRLEHIAVDPDGVIRLETLRLALREGKGRALVAVMAANNETGVIQPIEQVAGLAKEAEALLHVDAVQACGKLPIDFSASAADTMSVSAHKFGGPQGIGALVVREFARLAPQMTGGEQERGRRAGTESVAAIAGFGSAARALREDTNESARITELRDRFERSLRDIAEDVIIFGEEAVRLGNTSNFCMPGIAADTALMALDLDGVMVSSGAACSSGRVRPSHVLAAMGVAEDLAKCALRVSLGWNSTKDDVDAAVDSLSKLRARVIARAA